jgi:hypothetical protein
MRAFGRIRIERQAAMRELLQAALLFGTLLLQVYGWGSHDDSWCYTSVLSVFCHSIPRRKFITCGNRRHRWSRGGRLLLGLG